MYDNIIIVGTGKIAETSMRLILQKCTSECIYAYEYAPSPFSLLKKRAEKENVDYEAFYDKTILTEKLSVINGRTLIVSANNVYIFPKEICGKEGCTIINYHSSLLPKYAGMNATTWAIYHGEQEGGITWHYVDNELDHGYIITQKKCVIKKDMTALQLNREYDALATQALEEILPKLLECNSVSLDASNQNLNNRCVYRKKDVPDQGKIIPERGTIYCYRVLRSMDYGALPIFPMPQLKLEGKEWLIKKYKFQDAIGQGDCVAVHFVDNVIEVSDKEGTLLLWVDEKKVNAAFEKRGN